MSFERTAEVMHAYWRGDNGHQIAEDAVFHDMASGQVTKGRQAIIEMIDYMYHRAFEAEFDPIHTQVSNGSATAEGVFAGRHVGEFMGIPATQKLVEVPLAIT